MNVTSARLRAAAPPKGRSPVWVPLVPIGLSMVFLVALVHYHLAYAGREATSPFQHMVAGLYGWLGFVPSFVFCLLVSFWCTIWYLTGELERPWTRLGRVLLLTVCMAVLVNVSQETPQTHLGTLGQTLAGALRVWPGYITSCFLVAVVTLGAALLATDFFFYRYFEGIGRAAAESPAAEDADEQGVEDDATEAFKELAREVRSARVSNPASAPALPETASAAAAATVDFSDLEEEIPWEPSNEDGGDAPVSIDAAAPIVDDPNVDDPIEADSIEDPEPVVYRSRSRRRAAVDDDLEREIGDDVPFEAAPDLAGSSIAQSGPAGDDAAELASADAEIDDEEELAYGDDESEADLDEEDDTFDEDGAEEEDDVAEDEDLEFEGEDELEYEDEEEDEDEDEYEEEEEEDEYEEDEEDSDEDDEVELEYEEEDEDEDELEYEEDDVEDDELEYDEEDVEDEDDEAEDDEEADDVLEYEAYDEDEDEDEEGEAYAEDEADDEELVDPLHTSGPMSERSRRRDHEPEPGVLPFEAEALDLDDQPAAASAEGLLPFGEPMVEDAEPLAPAAAELADGGEADVEAGPGIEDDDADESDAEEDGREAREAYPEDEPVTVLPAMPPVQPVAPAPVGDVDAELLEEAADLVRSSGRASASFLQRRMRVDFEEAVDLLEALEVRGVVSLEADRTHGRVN